MVQELVSGLPEGVDTLPVHLLLDGAYLGVERTPHPEGGFGSVRQRQADVDDRVDAPARVEAWCARTPSEFATANSASDTEIEPEATAPTFFASAMICCAASARSSGVVAAVASAVALTGSMGGGAGSDLKSGLAAELRAMRDA